MSANGLPLAVDDQVQEEKDELKKELFSLQADFRGNTKQPEHTELENKLFLTPVSE